MSQISPVQLEMKKVSNGHLLNVPNKYNIEIKGVPNMDNHQTSFAVVSVSSLDDESESEDEVMSDFDKSSSSQSGTSSNSDTMQLFQQKRERRINSKDIHAICETDLAAMIGKKMSRLVWKEIIKTKSDMR